MGRDHPGFDDRSVALGWDRVVAELVLEHRVKAEDALHHSSKGTSPRLTARNQSPGSSAIGKLRRPLVSSSSPWKPSRAQCMAYFVS